MTVAVPLEGGKEQRGKHPRPARQLAQQQVRLVHQRAALSLARIRDPEQPGAVRALAHIGDVGVSVIDAEQKAAEAQPAPAC